MSSHVPIRVLVADDDPSVREAYRSIFLRRSSDELDAAGADLFGDAPAEAGDECCLTDVDVVEQGELAVQLADTRRREGRPFAVAFVDMRMPPGIDGTTTIERLWQVDPDLHIVLATAYSDTPWLQLRRRLGCSDRLVILRKPFEPVEAQQLVEALGRKRLQMDEVRNREQMLERMVEERTRELQGALASAAEAARVKGEFLANMSHEIRTPLTAILGFAELLRVRQMTDSERIDLAAVIDRNCTHLLQLVDSVLDLSKIEAGKLGVSQGVVDLRDLVDCVAQLMRPRAYMKGIALQVQYKENCPVGVWTDGMRVRQILLNLVGNAVKFTARGRVEVAVGCGGDATTPLLEVAVTDTGIGISPEQLGRVFQPFAQADASTTREFGGTGLGLALSRHLARLLGGELDVVSEAGRGSTFRLRLPLRVAAAPGAAPGLPEPLPEAARLDARILLVEDGQDNRRLLSTILRKSGADVVVAENGKVALDICAVQPTPFDLVVMDMQMPVMDGYTAARILRERGMRMPILALTAHALGGEKERCIAAGCDGYATKPIRARDLLATCASFLPTSVPPSAPTSAS